MRAPTGLLCGTGLFGYIKFYCKNSPAKQSGIVVYPTIVYNIYNICSEFIPGAWFPSWAFSCLFKLNSTFELEMTWLTTTTERPGMVEVKIRRLMNCYCLAMRRIRWGNPWGESPVPPLDAQKWYTPKKLTWRLLENPPFSIGNTSTQLVDFPASHVNFFGGCSFAETTKALKRQRRKIKIDFCRDEIAGVLRVWNQMLGVQEITCATSMRFDSLNQPGFHVMGYQLQFPGISNGWCCCFSSYVQMRCCYSWQGSSSGGRRVESPGLWQEFVTCLNKSQIQNVRTPNVFVWRGWPSYGMSQEDSKWLVNGL